MTLGGWRQGLRTSGGRTRWRFAGKLNTKTSKKKKKENGIIRNKTASTESYNHAQHDALPIYRSKKTQEMLEETLARSQGILHNELTNTRAKTKTIIYTQTLMTRRGTGEMEQQVRGVWLMRSTLTDGETNHQQGGRGKHGTQRRH